MRGLPFGLLLALALFDGSVARAVTLHADDRGRCPMPAHLWVGDGLGTIRPRLNLVLSWQPDTREGSIDLRFLFGARADDPEPVSAWIAAERFDSRDYGVTTAKVPFNGSTFRQAHLRLLSADPELTQRLMYAITGGQEVRAGVRRADGSLGLGIFPPLHPVLRQAFEDCLAGTVD